LKQGKTVADEVRLLAARLDEIASEMAPPELTRPRAHLTSLRLLIIESQLRIEIVTGCRFGDPAWDLLLRLYLAHLEERPMISTELCKEAALTETTGQRWIARLVEGGLLQQRTEAADRRARWVSLSPAGRTKMERYFEAIAGE
jgi:hypothetical protein